MTVWGVYLVFYGLLYGVAGLSGYLVGRWHRRVLRNATNLPTARAIQTGDVGVMPPTSHPNPPRIPARTYQVRNDTPYGTGYKAKGG